MRDTSGAVLPGVTVEAASPALIEKVRTVVTDGEGQYKIVDLVPGTYSVTFTLTGFNTIKREGVELTASFTATVNADLRVGSLTETVTVTGAAPTVDIQNVVQQRVMTRDVINAIPAGTKSVASIGVLIPGVVTQTQDVGGTAFSATAIAIHGSRFNEQQLLYDGVYYNHGAGSGGNFNTIVPNDATVQEVSLEVGSTSAESPNGGLRTNIIPRDGGNTFKGFFFGSFTDNKLQAGNLDDSLKALGLVSVPQVTRIYDIDPAFGGPLMKDKVWFYGSYRKQNSQQTVADRYFNLTPATPAYTPDFGEPGPEQRRERQPEPAPDVADQSEEQAEPAGAERPAEAALLWLRVLQRVHDLAGSDLLFRVASDVPGAVQLEFAGDVPSAARSIGRRRQQEFRDLPPAGHEPQPAVLDRAVDRRHLGQLLGRLRRQRELPVQHAARRVVCDRLARRRSSASPSCTARRTSRSRSSTTRSRTS